MIATVNVGNERSRAKMKKWFEKWLAEKARRREKNLPAVVDYRDETYVSDGDVDYADIPVVVEHHEESHWTTVLYITHHCNVDM